MQFSDAPTSFRQHLFRGGYLLQLLRVESLVAGAEMFSARGTRTQLLLLLFLLS